jgi:hypothetical protein
MQFTQLSSIEAALAPDCLDCLAWHPPTMAGPLLGSVFSLPSELLAGSKLHSLDHVRPPAA